MAQNSKSTSLATTVLLAMLLFTSHHAIAEVRCAGKRVEGIIIGTHATDVERFAAQQLQSYFSEMSAPSEPVPIITSDAPPAGTGFDIVLGQSTTNPYLARLCAVAKVRVDTATLGDDGYLIHQAGSALLLTGPQPRSALFAVYHLLESCGVRFYGYRARGGEIVPHSATIEIPALDIVEKPAMKYRFVSDNGIDVSEREKMVNIADWAAKNRCNAFTLTPSRAGETWEQMPLDEIRKRGLMIVGPGHVLAQFTPDAALFATHPEYFPMRDGKRVAKVAAAWGGVPSFCASNPSAMQLVVGNAVAYLEAHPFINVFAIYPPDGSQHGAQCQCEACAKQSASDWYLAFINGVARVLEAKHSAIKVMWISYNEFGMPPKVVRPANGGSNLVLLWCNDIRNFREAMDSDANRHAAPYLEWKPKLKSIKTDWMKDPGDHDLAAWYRWKTWADYLHASQYRGDVVLLEYYNGHVANSLRVPSLGFCPSGPWPAMARDFQFYQAQGIAGWQNCTDYYNDGPNPYWNWLSAQLLWNPKAGQPALDHDFYTHLYGPAASEMQHYFDGLWTGIAGLEKAGDLLPRLKDLDAILHRAETITTPREIAERIKTARSFHAHCITRAQELADAPPTGR